MSNSATQWTAAHQASLSVNNSQSLLRLVSIESVMPSNHLILFHPLLLLHQVAKVLEFQLQRQSFQSIQDWFPLGWTIGSLAVQGTLKSLLQHHSSKHQFFGAFFLYSPTLTSIHDHWKTIALNRWTFVGKVVSLFFNMLSSLVITFLPRS